MSRPIDKGLLDEVRWMLTQSGHREADPIPELVNGPKNTAYRAKVAKLAGYDVGRSRALDWVIVTKRTGPQLEDFDHVDGWRSIGDYLRDVQEVKDQLLPPAHETIVRIQWDRRNRGLATIEHPIGIFTQPSVSPARALLLAWTDFLDAYGVTVA